MHEGQSSIDAARGVAQYSWHVERRILNINAAIAQVLRRASEGVFVPLTVGGGIRGFTDGEGNKYSALDVAAEYFRSGADKVSIGSDAVDAAQAYMKSSVKTGTTAIEQISWVSISQEPCKAVGMMTNCVKA